MTFKTRYVVLMCYPTGDTGEYEYFETQEEGMARFEEMEKELEEDFTPEDNIYITFYQEEGDVDTTTPEDEWEMTYVKNIFTFELDGSEIPD